MHTSALTYSIACTPTLPPASRLAGPDFLSSAGINASFPGGKFNGTVLQEDFVEAPSLWRLRCVTLGSSYSLLQYRIGFSPFHTVAVQCCCNYSAGCHVARRPGHYFLTTGHCCCFCFQGSGMITYTAPHPLGPWMKQPGSLDLGCVLNASNPSPAAQHSLPLTAVGSPGQGCNYNGVQAASVSRAQQNFVLPLTTSDGKQQLPPAAATTMRADIIGHARINM